ncbi:alpha-1,2-fucosyltransferase [Megamonas sp.]
MLKIKLQGRLGNQLFIYAFARKCLEKYGQKILIYDRKNEKDITWYSHLDNYYLHPNIKFTSNKKEVTKMGGYAKLLYYYNHLRTKNKSARKRYETQQKWLNYYIQHGLILLTDGYFELPDKIPSDIYCEGYFQSAKFFDDIREQLLSELKPKDEHTTEEKAFIRQIKSTTSVCLTIRLGDYIGNTTHQVCTAKFYKNAMKKMKELYPDCIFYAFSDEVDKLKEIFDFDYPIIYDKGKSKDYMSLDIMSHCKHFIISNSTFSWWAQYLSTNPNKTVIAPPKWYAIDVPNDIMQDNWMLIDC